MNIKKTLPCSLVLSLVAHSCFASELPTSHLVASSVFRYEPFDQKIDDTAVVELERDELRFYSADQLVFTVAGEVLGVSFSVASKPSLSGSIVEGSDLSLLQVSGYLNDVDDFISLNIHFYMFKNKDAIYASVNRLESSSKTLWFDCLAKQQLPEVPSVVSEFYEALRIENEKVLGLPVDPFARRKKGSDGMTQGHR